MNYRELLFVGQNSSISNLQAAIADLEDASNIFMDLHGSVGEGRSAARGWDLTKGDGFFRISS